MRATGRLKIKPVRRPARRWPRLWPPSARTLWIAAAVSGAAAAVPAVYIARDLLPNVAREALTTVEARTLSISARLGLSVQEIYVEGRVETPAADVLAVLDVSRNAPILAFGPEIARGELEKLPWVKSASIERRLPDTVFVRLVEREPLALWQRHGQLSVIDRAGVEIRGADAARFNHLPVVVGDDAPGHAAALLALLATEPRLQRRIVAAVRTGGRRWNLQIDLGGRTIEALLPEINPGAAWARLAELERADGLLERRIAAIDLRLPDRLVVRVIQEPQPAAPPPTPRRTTKTDRKPT